MREPIKKRKDTYERYSKYIEKYIDNQNVAILPKVAIQRILDRSSSFLKEVEKKDYYPIMQDVLNEINRNYYNSYKKSILDYILKDPN